MFSIDDSSSQLKNSNLTMYRRPKFLEVLLKIREEMAREADYDVDLFVEIVRTGARPASGDGHSLAENDDQPGANTSGRRSGQSSNNSSK